MYACVKCGREWRDDVAARSAFQCKHVDDEGLPCRGSLGPVGDVQDQDHAGTPAPERAQAVSPRTEPTAGSVVRGSKLVPLLARLPFTVALVIDEYMREADDYTCLHRICAAIEITARFLTAVALADGQRRRVSAGTDWPKNLVVDLVQHLERPTLGSWKVLLESATAAFDGSEPGPFLPGLRRYAKDFGVALGGGKAKPDEKLLAMRNLVAHAGRLSDERARELMAAHTTKFEDLIAGLAFLDGARLVAVPENGAALDLTGLPEANGFRRIERSDLPLSLSAEGEERLALISLDGFVLDIRPLHAFGDVLRPGKPGEGLVASGERAAQIYSRAPDSGGLDFTVLGARVSDGRGSADLERRFEEVFQLKGWRERLRVQGALARYEFADRTRGLLGLFIGRDAQVDAATRAVLDGNAGVWWLSGKPGMGKSAFMAALARGLSLAATDQPGLVLIPYFFAASDGDRCRTSSFAEAVLLHLGAASGREIKVEADPKKRIEQATEALRHAEPAGVRPATGAAGSAVRRVIVIADGIDEVVGIDPDFLEVVFRAQGVAVTWVCAGRDEGNLPRRFARPLSRWLFEMNSGERALNVAALDEEGLLPPLSPEDVRGFLHEEMGHRLPGLLAADRRTADGSYANRFVDAVVVRSGGLPLYLRLLVADLFAGRLDFSTSVEKLPRGLEEYYDRLIDEMGDDLRAALPAVTTLLAMAKEPLPLDVLATLLADHELVGPSDGQELLVDALRYGHVMLKRAPTSFAPDPGESPVLGYDLYHQSFRQHVLSSARVRRSCNAARDRLCRLALGWSGYAAGSATCRYALAFGPAHLKEAGRWGDVVALLSDPPFIEAKTVALGVHTVMDDLTSALGREGLPHGDDRTIIEAIARVVGRRLPTLIVWPAEILTLARDDCFLEANDSEALEGYVSVLDRWLLERVGRSWLKRTARPETSARTSVRLLLSGHSGTVEAVRFSKDGARIVSAALDDTIREWEATTGKLIRVIAGPCHHAIPDNRAGCGPGAVVDAIAWSDDGARVASAADFLQVWDAETGAVIRTLQATGIWNRCSAIAWSHDGTRIASGCSGSDGFCVWDADTGEKNTTLRSGYTRPGYVLGKVTALAWYANDARLVSVHEHGSVWVWDPTTGREIARLSEQTLKSEYAVAVSPDGTQIASGGEQSIRLWGAETGQEVATLLHGGTVAVAAYSPDGRQIATGSWDNTVRVWDVMTRREILTLSWLHSGVDRSTSGVSAIAYSPDGGQIVSGGSGCNVYAWDSAMGPETSVRRGHRKKVTAVAYSPDGTLVVSGSEDGSLKIWDSTTTQELRAFSDGDREITSVAWSIDGRRIVSGHKFCCMVWEASTGRKLAELAEPSVGSGLHLLPVLAVAISPGGTRVASGHEFGALRIWDVATGRNVLTMVGHECVPEIAYSPDGSRVASAGKYNEPIRVWNESTGEQLTTLAGHGDWVRTVTFSPDGTRIASGGVDRVVRIWHAPTGHQIARLTGHGSEVSSLTYSPDCARIVSCDESGEVMLWDAHSFTRILRHTFGACVRACHYSAYPRISLIRRILGFDLFRSRTPLELANRDFIRICDTGGAPLHYPCSHLFEVEMP